ncbi:MAG: hypothetical protein IPG03_13995 [Candidatus Microthrix sp.]|nr:hypothetical protein [Candidatus Microthrix sp.]MBK6503414.1 hypothetical protein [Candidatus Microthrix sp.]
MTTGPEPMETNTDPQPAEREVRSAASKIRSILGVAVVAVTGLFIVIYALPDSPIKRHVPLWVFHTGDALSSIRTGRCLLLTLQPPMCSWTWW